MKQGHITYMRTDSVNIVPEALEEIRKVINNKFGKSYLPDKPRYYKSKSKNTQEAHETIRPTSPDKQPSLSGDEENSLQSYLATNDLHHKWNQPRLNELQY